MTSLSNEVEFYKSLLKVSKIDPENDSEVFKFLREENFMIDGISNVIKESPELVKMSTHVHQWESAGNASEARINLLKNAFKIIIDFCVPISVKTCIIAYRN